MVYSEGILYLDDCDFTESTASTLVFSGNETTTVVRNAILGDNNCEDINKPKFWNDFFTSLPTSYPFLPCLSWCRGEMLESVSSSIIRGKRGERKDMLVWKDQHEENWVNTDGVGQTVKMTILLYTPNIVIYYHIHSNVLQRRRHGLSAAYLCSPLNIDTGFLRPTYVHHPIRNTVLSCCLFRVSCSDFSEKSSIFRLIEISIWL